MIKTLRSALALSALLLSSCSILPTFLGGYETANLLLPNFLDPTAPIVEVGLCSSGDDESQDGIRQVRQGDLAMAREHFEKSLVYWQSNGKQVANAHWLAAVLQERTGAYDQALKNYKGAADLAPCALYEEAVNRARHKSERASVSEASGGDVPKGSR